MLIQKSDKKNLNNSKVSSIKKKVNKLLGIENIKYFQSKISFFFFFLLVRFLSIFSIQKPPDGKYFAQRGKKRIECKYGSVYVYINIKRKKKKNDGVISAC